MRDNEALLKQAQAGDEKAFEEIISSNLGLVKKIALKFTDRGVDFEDLVQIGSIGMIKAVRSFDFSYECMFSTYAVPLILGEIRRFLRDDGMIKVSRQTKRQGIEILRKKESFIKEQGREPKLTELAALCEMSTDELIYALDAVNPVHSLNESVGDDDGELGDFVADKNNEMEVLTDKIALAQAIKALPEMQQKIIMLRFFKDMSQQQTGQMLGLSQVKISREEKKIMNTLRQAL
ncbi:MAG: sigma-70 family RNA polymerase sigma factor [Clostridiales bacterium]|nr:sigma-70 family RNA polymerase sigma factor [Clostridiales bacterium]